MSDPIQKKVIDVDGLLFFWSYLKNTFIHDSTYIATPSTSGSGGSAGLMSAIDKEKLNGITTGAEVNQNAFSNIKITPASGSSTTIEADTKTDTFEIVAGSNITITPDTTNDKITIAATDTTYNAAVASENGSGGSDGLITAANQEKLNGIAIGAEVNQNAFSNIKIDSTTIVADGKTDTLELVAGSNITLTPDTANDKITIIATDTTYSVVTASTSGVGGTDGLMSASDKEKLNGVATGAEVNQNAFSNIKIGESTVTADTKTDTFEIIAGSNITLTPDTTNDKVTITATDTTYSTLDASTINTGTEEVPKVVTAKAIKTAITTALGGVTGVSFYVPANNTLPQTGDAGTIYLISNVPSGYDGDNTYDEYIYYNDTWERIGSTGINLDGYWNDEDLAIATNTDINTTVFQISSGT